MARIPAPLTAIAAVGNLSLLKIFERPPSVISEGNFPFIIWLTTLAPGIVEVSNFGRFGSPGISTCWTFGRLTFGSFDKISGSIVGSLDRLFDRLSFKESAFGIFGRPFCSSLDGNFSRISNSSVNFGISSFGRFSFGTSHGAI
jgi:hypothetical protein